MVEKEAIERALETERRMLQRQQLLKRLWKLNQRDQLSAGANRQTNGPASDKTSKYRDNKKSVLARTPVVA